MKVFSNSPTIKRAFAALLLGSLLSVQLFAQAVAPATAPAASPLLAVEKELADKITVQNIKDVTTALSADDMEGRGTAQPGGDKAANWIAERFKSLGLKPLGDKGNYLQKIEFKETVATPETSFKVGDESLDYGSDFAFVPQNNGNKEASGDLVFVSYGIQAKQANIDMLAGANLMGKVVIITQGPPPGFPEKDWEKQKASTMIRRNII